MYSFEMSEYTLESALESTSKMLKEALIENQQLKEKLKHQEFLVTILKQREEQLKTLYQATDAHKNQLIDRIIKELTSLKD